MTGVIILNYNSADDTLKCVSVLRKHTGIDNYIYIVDNCSTDNSVDILMKKLAEYEKLEIILSDENKGYSCGNNIGIKKALKDGCDDIVIINPDVEIGLGTIDKLIEDIHGEGNYAVAGPKIINYDGSTNIFINNSWSYGKMLLEKQPLFKIYNLLRKTKKKGIKKMPEKFTRVEGMVSGCCFAIRGDVMKDIGFFDEDIFLYCEEAVLWEKLTEKHYTVCYDPDVYAVHKGSVSIGGWISPFSRRCYSISLLILIKKYKNIKGLKMKIAKFLTKVDYVLLSKKFGQDYKLQYKILKDQIKAI